MTAPKPITARQLETRNITSWVILAAVVIAVPYLSLRFMASQRAQARAVRRTELVILSAPAAIIVCDEVGRITLVNPRAGTLLGWSPEELLGRHINTVIPPELRAAHDAAMQTAVNLIRKHNDDWLLRRENQVTEALHKDGHRVPLRFTVRVIRNDGEIEFIASMSPLHLEETVEMMPLDSLTPDKIIAP